jgi:hypothetical protein
MGRPSWEGSHKMRGGGQHHGKCAGEGGQWDWVRGQSRAMGSAGPCEGCKGHLGKAPKEFTRRTQGAINQTQLLDTPALHRAQSGFLRSKSLRAGPLILPPSPVVPPEFVTLFFS